MFTIPKGAIVYLEQGFRISLTAGTFVFPSFCRGQSIALFVGENSKYSLNTFFPTPLQFSKAEVNGHFPFG